jgi:hypothetical protein
MHRMGAVLLVVLLLAIRVDAQASTRPVVPDQVPVDLDAIRAAKRIVAVRTDQPIRIDGVLDEPAWERAPVATDFYQQQPAEFSLATRRTEVRFLYDDEMLYVGAVLYDPEPERLITNELKRDFGGSSGDGFGLLLDTFQDRRSAYGFITNPGGAQRDSLGYDNGRRNDANWDAVWFVRTAIRPDGWSLEYAIPLKTLRFPDRPVQEWGMNMVRWARRANETSTWAPVPRQFSHYNVAYAGTLAGIAGAERGRHLQVKPFLTGSVLHPLPGAPWARDADGGVDVKWGLSSSLLLDATWRTDFSQVEVDEQQINLTRFSLFFPEKREFFLESPSAFQIGLVESNNETARRELVPFFSRRIGLSDSGQPIPVVGGLRLTGRAGPHSVGVMTMHVEGEEEAWGTTFAAARVARELTSTASASAFYFGRESDGPDSFNRVMGAELRLRPTRTVEAEAFAMRSLSDGQSGGWAGRGSLRVDANAHRVRLGYVHVGDAFQHDLGFVRRRGIGTLFSSYTRVLRGAEARGRIREHTITAKYDTTVDDRFTTVLTGTGGLTVGTLFHNSAQVRGWLTTTYERLDAPFRVGPTLTIAPGEYRYEGYGLSVDGNRSAVVSGGVEFSGGEFWTGRQRAASASLRYRLSAHLAASASVSRSTVRLPDGAFTGDLLGLRLDWSFTPRMFLNAFVQHNSEADAWLANVRFNLIHRPLSDIYVVWTETHVPGLTSRALLLKYTHLLSF